MLSSITFTTPQGERITWYGGTVRYTHRVAGTVTESFYFEDFWLTSSVDPGPLHRKRGIVTFNAFVLLFAITDEVYLLPEKVSKVECKKADGWLLVVYHCDTAKAREWFDTDAIDTFALATRWALAGTEYRPPGLTTR